MALTPTRRTQTLTIIAQDPSVKIKKPGAAAETILTARVELPAEELAPGPRGYRVQVIDYDSTAGVLYPPLEYRVLENGIYNDPFIDEPDSTLLTDPLFHAQNVYAIVMRTLARFELALGRRVSWSFGGHQLQIAPHAFVNANAFYSKKDRALLFGYFPRSDESEGGNVFTCLSHDIVVHETTHALVDGLRERYTDPSSPEQAGFHEGFADVVALLSIFSLRNVVASIIDKNFAGNLPADPDPQRIDTASLTPKALRGSLILGLAEQFGEEVFGTRGKALRRSVELNPSPEHISSPEFEEPHKRGELLSAAVMNTFIEVWIKRLEGLGNRPPQNRAAGEGAAGEATNEAYRFLDRSRVVEEGASIAEYLLTMVIRALDYSPPSDVEFCDFLSAVLTGDREVKPDDSKYQFRSNLLKSFKAYGIEPTSKGDGNEEGVWEPPHCELSYNRIHLESLVRDKDEMFRFIWENRKSLGLEEQAYTRVLSVRPCVRVNPDDGFTLRETVAEYHQTLTLQAAELKHLGIKKPAPMPETQEVTLYGGGALIFDEFGRVKFHIRNRLLNPERQTRRLKYLWKYGEFRSDGQDKNATRRFAQMHRARFNHLEEEGVTDDNYLEK